MPVPCLIRVYYYMLDFPLIVAPPIIQQYEDIVPHIPRTSRFLEQLQVAGAVFNIIELDSGGLGRTAEVRFIRGRFVLQ